MKELVEFIANQLVDDKSQVVVKEIDDGVRVVVNLQVSKEDMVINLNIIEKKPEV